MRCPARRERTGKAAARRQGWTDQTLLSLLAVVAGLRSSRCGDRHRGGDMAYTVPERIIGETKLCEHGYRCLSEGDGHVRRAQRLIPGDGVFVPGGRAVDCPYAETCEGGLSCSCPVRIQLFKEYGL